MTKKLSLSDKVQSGGFSNGIPEAEEDTKDFLSRMLGDEDEEDDILDNSDGTVGGISDLVKTKNIEPEETEEIVFNGGEEYSGLEDEEDAITEMPKTVSEDKKSDVVDEDSGDDKSYGKKISKDQLIAVVIAAGILIFLFVFFVFTEPSTKEPSDDKGQQETVQEQSQASPVNVQEKIVYKYEEPPKDYTEYVEIPEKYYSDKLVVSKYATLTDNTVAFYFMGIPENFKQKIVFPVSVATYNQIANGSVLNIDYKVVSKNGSDFVIDVVTNIGGI